MIRRMFVDGNDGTDNKLFELDQIKEVIIVLYIIVRSFVKNSSLKKE